MKNLLRLLAMLEASEGDISPEFAKYLQVFPLMNACEIKQLTSLCIAEGMPHGSVVFFQDRETERSIMDNLVYLHKWHNNVTVTGDKIIIDTGLGGLTSFTGSKLIIAYLAVLAWWDVHPLKLTRSTLTGQARMDEIIAEIPYRSAGLNLDELIDLSVELDWNQKIGNAPEGTEIGEVIIEECLNSVAHRYCTISENYIMFSSRTLRGYKINDARWIPVFEALQKRLEFLSVGVPGFSKPYKGKKQ